MRFTYSSDTDSNWKAFHHMKWIPRFKRNPFHSFMRFGLPLTYVLNISFSGAISASRWFYYRMLFVSPQRRFGCRVCPFSFAPLRRSGLLVFFVGWCGCRFIVLLRLPWADKSTRAQKTDERMVVAEVHNSVYGEASTTERMHSLIWSSGRRAVVWSCGLSLVGWIWNRGGILCCIGTLCGHHNFSYRNLERWLCELERVLSNCYAGSVEWERISKIWWCLDILWK